MEIVALGTVTAASMGKDDITWLLCHARTLCDYHSTRKIPNISAENLSQLPFFSNLIARIVLEIQNSSVKRVKQFKNVTLR